LHQIHYFDYACIHTYHAQTSQQILQREWPDEFQAALDTLVDASAEKVMTGHSETPHIHNPMKCKATDESVGRVPVTFGPPVEQSASPSTSTQATLNASWGEAKITAVRQAFIDYHLLRFIVCCAIAFSVVDSGFFIDLVKAL
jgi:hypothetical protein